MLTSEQRWAAVLGDRTEDDVLAEAAADGVEVAEWLKAAVDEAIAQGLDDDPMLVLEDLLAQVGA